MGENVDFQIKKKSENFGPISFYRTYYFGKRHDMIQFTTFKNEHGRQKYDIYITELMYVKEF